MPEVIAPSWADLQALIGDAHDRLTLVTPFYSEDGIEQVFDALGDDTFVSVTTRLSPPDWVAGVADPDALVALLDLLPGRHSLGIMQRLHAKAYVADRTHALIGSANLSEGGFRRNLELMVRFRGSEAADALDAIDAACAPATTLALPDLLGWMSSARPAIENAKKATTEAAEELAPAQAQLDTLLGFGRSIRSLPNPTAPELTDFIDWARRHSSLAGAEMIVRRHDNVDEHQLQGHVKQSFFSSLRFLAEHPEVRPPLVASLATLQPGAVYQLGPAVGDAWLRHVDEHATDTSGDGTWSYPVLRGLMPPSMGGTRQNGGGGISTLKRMLPLVASYLAESGP